jgi:hypothetical protein
MLLIYYISPDRRGLYGAGLPFAEEGFQWKLFYILRLPRRLPPPMN